MRKRILIAFLLLGFSSHVLGRKEPVFIAREDSSLLLPWGPAETGPLGDGERWVLSLNGPWQINKSKTNQTNSVLVPCCYVGPHLLKFERSFKIPLDLPRGMTPIFRALGVAHHCRVFMDGALVGSHSGGYTPFSMPLDHLAPGSTHEILLEVDSRLGYHNSVPHAPETKAWMNYGGPHGDVYIEFLNQNHLDDIRIIAKVLPRPPSCILIAEGSVNGAGLKDHWVTLEIHSGREDDEAEPLCSEEHLIKKGSFRISAVLPSPNLWSPEDPRRYEVTVVLKDDEGIRDRWRRSFGIRQLDVNQGQILLNGQPISLEGVVWSKSKHREGLSLSKAILEREIDELKERPWLNAVRLTYGLPHPYFVELCEREGILLLEEIPVWRIPAHHLVREEFLQGAIGQTMEMVRRDRNSASILSWGLGTEIDSTTDDCSTYLYELQGALRTLDDRPCHFFSGMKGKETCGDLVDLLGISMGVDDIDILKSGIQDVMNLYPGKPLLLSGGEELVPPREARELRLLSSVQGVFGSRATTEAVETTGVITSKGEMALLIWTMRITTALSFCLVFLAPARKLHRFEEGGGRAAGTCFVYLSCSLAGTSFWILLNSEQRIHRWLDLWARQLLTDKEWQEKFKAALNEELSFVIILLALFLSSWLILSVLPAIVSRGRKIPGDRVGLPPAALGLLLYPMMCLCLGKGVIEFRYLWLHIGGIAVAISTAVIFYVRNSAVRWRVGRLRLFVSLFVILAVALAACLLFLQSTRAAIDYLVFYGRLYGSS